MRIRAALASIAMVVISCVVVSSCSSGSHPGPALPGGTSGKAVLQAHHLLDAQGRVSPGLTAPTGADVNAAICSYVFGTADEVGAAAKLHGVVTLSKDSGYHYLGGNGSGLVCGYNLSGARAFALVIWDHNATHVSGVRHWVTVDLPNRFYGASGYAPNYHGEAIAAADAQRWLREAAGRVAHGSV